tara:strand:+ start:10585 stop:11877 length:1293 start_codon:yes stop_codon:yes gene_type:complete
LKIKIIMGEKMNKNIKQKFPLKGIGKSKIFSEMDQKATLDLKWKERLAGGVSYPAGDDVLNIAKEAYLKFFSANALYKNIFSSVAQFEQDLVDMAANLFNSDKATGSITSGGSESILLAIKASRDRAKLLHPDIKYPEMIVPESAHPAFWKGAHYFGLKIIATPLLNDGMIDMKSYLNAVNKNTVLMVGSAPSLTLGMIDPISEMAAVADKNNINFHVDACVGGFFLPFIERSGEDLEIWDFRVPGVTSISADLHKFGYTAKGASLIMSRDEDIFKHQIFEWGPPHRSKDYYVTPNMAGTRPGGGIASAWAVVKYLGIEGYTKLVTDTMNYIKRFQNGINSINGLNVLGKPVMSVFAYSSESLNIYSIASGMEDRGWLVGKDSFPFKAIRFMQSPGHAPYIEDYLRDLEHVTKLVKESKISEKEESANYN